MTRPTYLLVLASSCQMYSGTGRAVFDWLRYAEDRFEFSVLMDSQTEHNFRLTREFCEERGITFLASPALPLAGCLDSGVRRVAEVLTSTHYDIVECVSWASAATNLSVLTSLPRESRLVFVPHSQPIWTLPDHESYFMTSRVFRRMLEEADHTFLDSTQERLLPEFAELPHDRVRVVPLGVDTGAYAPGATRRGAKGVLTICDVREQRKRIDLLLAAFAHAHAVDAELRLTIGGRGSDTLPVPPELRDAITLLGYVDETTLVSLYREASLFALMTDYEAFGLPIAEALCCGTPVLLNRLPVLESLFADLPGVTFTDNRDPALSGRLMLEAMASAPDPSDVAEAAHRAFAFEATYGLKAQIIEGLACESVA